MASSNDVTKENVGAQKPDDSKKRETFKWTDQEVLILCRILNKYYMNHGRNTPFNWNEIQSDFEKSAKTKVYSYRVLKNKYDDQRKEYNLWTSLKHGATGLGWDAGTGTLNCSDEWWEKKMQENDKFKRLRKKQPSLELQETWYQLFGDKVATGVEVVAPSINPSTFVAPSVNPSTSSDSYHVNLEGEDEDLEAENGLEDLEAENETFFSSFIDEVGSGNVSTSNQIGGSKLAKKSVKTSTKPAQMKRCGRESAGIALFKKIMSEQNATQQRALQLLELDTTNEVSKTNVDSVITVMNRMVEQKLLPEYGDLWCFGMTVLEDPVKREFFLNFPADAGRVAWLQYQQKLGK
ncbi:myb/SANT-like domain-containing protein [Artemisia annua]|uniref:Myb/SANT-like domain-containing protein n=1 Tax=Artemisia annua TaxID=35608 RepID=A0A2U1NSI3_ARTAN|nr:myb/SANT-like domain-containing protein [Artemisia annua]